MREFQLALPTRPGPAPGLREEFPEILRIATDESLYIPKVLQRDGLAGYEAESLALFFALLERKAGGTLFDVGANVGVFSLLAAALTNWRITAFEPVPDLAEVARELARENTLAIEVEEMALGRQDGTATLFLSSVTDSSNSLREGFRPASGSLEVPLRTVDRYTAQNGLVPDILKLDTETTEPDILDGARRLLDVHRPWILCEVLAGRTEDELNRIVDRHGYRAYQITGSWPPDAVATIAGDRSHRHNNWLFAPETPDAALWTAASRWAGQLADCLPSGRRSHDLLRVDRPATSWSDPENPGMLAARWRPRIANPKCLPVVDAGSLLVHCSLVPEGRAYLSHGGTSFERPPDDAEDWPLEPERTYEIEIDFQPVDDAPTIQLWIIQYGGGERLTHVNANLRPGSNALHFRGAEGADAARVALRFAGSGLARLSPIRWFESR